MDEKTIVIISFLGDPMIPATSRDIRSGGFNTDVREWITRLSETSYNIAVFTNKSSLFNDEVQIINENINIYRIELDEKILHDANKLSSEIPNLINDVKNILNTKKIQPAFFHSYFWVSGYIAMKLSSHYKTAFLHTVIDISAYKKISGRKVDYHIQEKYENEFFPKANCILAITEAEKNVVIDNYSVNKDKIIVVGREANKDFLYSDHDSFGNSFDKQNNNWKEVFYSSNNELVINNSNWWNSGAFLYMGRLEIMKGIPIIINAWFELYQKYKENTPPLWIVGGTPEAIYKFRSYIKKNIPILDTLEKSLKICWWGYLSANSINALLMKSLVLVVHSQYEAGGLVIIESMCSKVPVIATPFGFAADLIKDWNNGFLVPYGDIELLSKRMEHFIQQPLISRALGSYAKETYDYYTQKWNCYSVHFNIYEKYFKNSDYYINNLELDQSYDNKFLSKRCDFERRIINSYPYGRNKSKQIIEKGLLFLNNDSFMYEEYLSNTTDIFSFTYDDNFYYLKKLYSIFNIEKIWNHKAEKEAITSFERFNLIRICCLNTKVNKYIYLNENEKLFVFHKYNEVKLCIDNFEKILYLINSFNENNVDILKKEISILSDKLSYSYECHTLNNVYHNLTRPPFSSKQFENLLNRVKQKIDPNIMKNRKDSEKMCWNYGKFFNNHILEKNNQLFLIATDTLFIGEKGFDFAVFLVEYLKLFKISDINIILNYVNKCSEISNISVNKVILFCICIVLSQLNKEYTMYTIKNEYYELLLNVFINNLSK